MKHIVLGLLVAAAVFVLSGAYYKAWTSKDNSESYPSPVA